MVKMTMIHHVKQAVVARVITDHHLQHKDPEVMRTTMDHHQQVVLGVVRKIMVHQHQQEVQGTIKMEAFPPLKLYQRPSLVKGRHQNQPRPLVVDLVKALEMVKMRTLPHLAMLYP
jgi:hypothetical protein